MNSIESAHGTPTPPRSSGVPMHVFMGLAGLNFLRIGCQIVVVAWSAVSITGRASAVGQILMISSIANLACSPLLGLLVDLSRRKKRLVVAGHIGVAASAAIPACRQSIFAHPVDFESVAAMVLLAGISSAIASGAMDYFLKAHVPTHERTAKLSLLSSTTQVALILGTALGGLVVASATPSAAFLVISACSAGLAALCVVRLPALNAKTPGVIGFRRGLLAVGPALYLKHSRLLMIAACAALAFSIGQVTNTLLPALIKVRLGRSGNDYSTVEIAWSLGALLIGIFLSNRAVNRPGHLSSDLFVVLGMAATAYMVPHIKSFPLLLVAHFALGTAFSYVRIRSETRFLTECPTHLLGRFRANSMLITSTLGLVIFAAPTLYSDAQITDLYTGLSAVVAASTVIALGCVRRDR